jgi:hypothetical protein
MVECRGSRVIGRGSRVISPGSRVEGHRSRVRSRGRGSKVEVEGQRSRLRVKSRGSIRYSHSDPQYLYYKHVYPFMDRVNVWSCMAEKLKRTLVGKLKRTLAQ